MNRKNWITRLSRNSLALALRANRLAASLRLFREPGFRLRDATAPSKRFYRMQHVCQAVTLTNSWGNKLSPEWLWLSFTDICFILFQFVAIRSNLISIKCIIRISCICVFDVCFVTCTCRVFLRAKCLFPCVDKRNIYWESKILLNIWKCYIYWICLQLHWHFHLLYSVGLWNVSLAVIQNRNIEMLIFVSWQIGKTAYSRS